MKLRRSSRIALLGKKKIRQKKKEICIPRRSARLAALRRGKPNKYFIRHRPTVLDTLPLDVISNNIFGFLDYNSRINLNQCLPIWDRISKRMNKDSMLKHDINMRVKIISTNLTSIELFDEGTRLLKVISLFKRLIEPSYFELIKKFPQFRNVVLQKIEELKEDIQERHEFLPADNINECLNTFNEITQLIKKSSPSFSAETLLLNRIDTLQFI
jgi:hypothetical protein